MRSCSKTAWLQTGAILFGLCATLVVSSSAGAEVEILTTDGRVLAGEVDARTTADHLWVRKQSENIILVTSVRWSEIGSAKVDGQPLDAAQLAERSDQLSDEIGANFFSVRPQSSPASSSGPSPAVEAHTGRITSIEIEAALVNLDRDVEPDGYEVAIVAIDEFGQEVPAKGNIYVRLMGERNVHHTGRIRFEVFETWSQPVAPHHFKDGVAMYVLPFRAFNPEFDDELRPDAQLNVRLGAFGEGNFAATVPVPLWNFGPYRDRLQMFEGSRFFRDELSGRVRHHRDDAPGIYRRDWSR
jgi:hypothetical protein